MKGVLRLAAVFAAIAVLAMPLAGAEAPVAAEKGNPFGLEKIIAFYGGDIKSQSFARIHSRGDWRAWKARGGVASAGITHQGFLSKSVEEASDYLVNIDFGDNPNPVLNIDEFGWDFDGGIDQHTAAILKAVHGKKPEMKIAVWQSSPVTPELAAVYRDTVELVMLETYFDLTDAWTIAFQLQTARLTGLVDRSVVGLGLGGEGEDGGGWAWTRTAEELDQQVRLIRFVAPESPGLAFFGKFLTGDRAMRMTDEQLEGICSRFNEFPTDGTGLRPELLKLGKAFTKRYKGPAVFCSSAFVYPHFHSGHDGGAFGSSIDPPVARVLMMNLGKRDAKGVKVRLRTRDEGSELWAAGSVDIPARSVVATALPVLPSQRFRGLPLGSSVMEVDAPGCEVFNYTDSRYHGIARKWAAEQ